MLLFSALSCCSSAWDWRCSVSDLRSSASDLRRSASVCSTIRVIFCACTRWRSTSPSLSVTLRTASSRSRSRSSMRCRELSSTSRSLHCWAASCALRACCGTAPAPVPAVILECQGTVSSDLCSPGDASSPRRHRPALGSRAVWATGSCCHAPRGKRPLVSVLDPSKPPWQRRVPSGRCTPPDPPYDLCSLGDASSPRRHRPALGSRAV
mmetsp:Transcript_4679/g.14288  ORF Transcript_4679/g.14288 Transcript_4679/m.14288 type:complete len:209 (+) Transcript_4679:1177-1803(+)